MAEHFKPVVCKKCGREYERAVCPYCIYQKVWDKKPFEQKAKEFPPRIQKLLQQDLEYPNMPNKAQSMFIYGRVGGGKTLFACKMLLNEKERCFVERHKCTIEFLPIDQLLLEVKEGYENKLSDQSILEKYKNCTWLVIDDLGSERLSEWSYSILYNIVNYRYENLKNTVFTSNYSIDDLAENMRDQRIARRVNEMVEAKIKFD